MSYEIDNRIYNIRIECIDVFSLSGGCVSDFKQQLEAVRDRMAPIFYKESGYVPTEWAVMNYKAGFNAAIPIILKAVEQRDFEMGAGAVPSEKYNKELLKLLGDV